MVFYIWLLYAFKNSILYFEKLIIKWPKLFTINNLGRNHNISYILKMLAKKLASNIYHSDHLYIFHL